MGWELRIKKIVYCKLAQFADLRGSFAKKGGGVFEGVIPKCTLWEIKS